MKRFLISCALLAALYGMVSAQQAVAPRAAFAERPAMLTAIGQSADYEMVKVLLTRNKVPFAADPLVKAENLEGPAKTLVLVVGASAKGLGAAGISAEAELVRTKALLKRARELKMSVITLHVGGAARRGAMSETLIEPCMAASDYAVVVQSGNEDGFFTKLAAKAGIALTSVERISAVGAPLAAAFK